MGQKKFFPYIIKIFSQMFRVIQPPYIPSILADLFVQLSLAEFHLLLESRSLSRVGPSVSRPAPPGTPVACPAPAAAVSSEPLVPSAESRLSLPAARTILELPYIYHTHSALNSYLSLSIVGAHYGG
jgi:hypothetical protein